jgi:nucleoside-diphosphate-sugar epimerase
MPAWRPALREKSNSTAATTLRVLFVEACLSSLVSCNLRDDEEDWLTTLITGASGFLGARLAEMLVAAGESVRLLVRPSSRLEARLEKETEVMRGSFDDRDAIARAMRGVRVVYHCAAHSSDWGEWEIFHAANVDAVANLLEAARQASVARFVHVSTTDIYGYPKVPCDETYGVRDTGLPYNRSKGLGDRLALDFHRRTGLPVTVVRPATIFGPRSKEWSIELSRHLIAGHVVTVGGGHTPAGLVYVDDVADAMMRLAESDAAIGEAYNVVDPEALSWRDYFDVVADALGVRRPRFDVPTPIAVGIARLSESLYRAFGTTSRPLFTRHLLMILTRNQHYDTAKLHRTIAGFPKIGLEPGLALTLVWLRSSEGLRAIGQRAGGV